MWPKDFNILIDLTVIVYNLPWYVLSEALRDVRCGRHLLAISIAGDILPV